MSRSGTAYVTEERPEIPLMRLRRSGVESTWPTELETSNRSSSNRTSATDQSYSTFTWQILPNGTVPSCNEWLVSRVMIIGVTDGILRASGPSQHQMIAATLFGTMWRSLPFYIIHHTFISKVLRRMIDSVIHSKVSCIDCSMITLWTSTSHSQVRKVSQLCNCHKFFLVLFYADFPLMLKKVGIFRNRMISTLFHVALEQKYHATISQRFIIQISNFFTLTECQRPLQRIFIQESRRKTDWHPWWTSTKETTRSKFQEPRRHHRRLRLIIFVSWLPLTTDGSVSQTPCSCEGR